MMENALAQIELMAMSGMSIRIYHNPDHGWRTTASQMMDARFYESSDEEKETMATSINGCYVRFILNESTDPEVADLPLFERMSDAETNQ